MASRGFLAPVAAGVFMFGGALKDWLPNLLDGRFTLYCNMLYFFLTDDINKYN